MLRPALTLILGLAVVLGACGADEPGDRAAPRSPSTSTATSSSGLVMVVLGDSEATGAGDETGKGWAGRYAELVQAETGQAVETRSHATEGQTTADLLDSLRGERQIQDDVAGADIVAIGTGGADLNTGDEAYLSGSCEPRACYDKTLGDFAANIEKIVGEIEALSDGHPVVLRAITSPNVVPGAEDVIPRELVEPAKKFGLLQARSLRDSTCRAVRGHGGECIDALTAFNGPSGTADAYRTGLLNHDDCCYPSSKGQQRMAELLLALGTEPQVLD